MFQKHPILIPGRTKEGSTHWPTPFPIGLSHSHGRCGLEGEPRWQCAVPATGPEPRTSPPVRRARHSWGRTSAQQSLASKEPLCFSHLVAGESHWKHLPAPSTLSKTPPQSPQGYERHTRAHTPHNDLMFSFKFSRIL